MHIIERILCLVATGIVALLFAIPVRAATINVFPDDLVAPCQLREAVESANTDTSVGGCIAGDGADQLVLLQYDDRPFFTIDNPVGADEDGNDTGDIDVSSVISIVGSGPTQSVIIGPAFDRAFDVRTNGTLILTNLSVIGGSVIGATANDGGVVRKSGAGVLAINRSVLRGGNADQGGAIHATGSGEMTLDKVTLFGNRAVGGGAMAIQQAAGNMALLTNVTISGNNASTRAGGILTYGDMRLRNVTVARNRSAGTGGIHYAGTTNTTGINFANSLIVDNIGAAGESSDLACSGASSVQLGSFSHTMTRAVENCTFASFAGIPTSNDARLSPMFDAGAGIPIHALMPGSAALGAGNPSSANALTACTTQDARGVTRLASCDLGAYEERFDVTVNSFSDLPDLNPGDGICQALGNVCTLRALAMESNASPGRWFARLIGGTYTLSRPFNDFDDFDGGDLDFRLTDHEIPSQVTLYGAGPATTRIVGSSFDRVIEVRGRSVQGPSLDYVHHPLSFALLNATIEGGNLSRDPFQQDPNAPLAGGGIKITGGKSLLYDVVVRDNYVESLPAEDDSVAGGVWIDVALGSNATDRPYLASARLERFAIVDNATGDAGGGYGKFAGGLRGYGGGDFEISDGLTLTNGLIAGNHSRSAGGAMLFGIVAASFLTIVDNTSGPLAPSGFTQYAGGLTYGSQTNVMSHLLIAGNTADGVASDCEAIGTGSSLVSLGFNLIETAGSGCIISGDVASNQLGVDPLLGPRIETSGMPAYVPTSDSPAIDAAPPGRCDDARGFGLTEDARGLRRAAAGDTSCDIGAIEAERPLFSDGFE